MATPNTFPCPNCRAEIIKPEDMNDWEFQERADGANHWKAEEDVVCQDCFAVIKATFWGTSVGHPDQGEPVENIEMIDHELKGVPTPESIGQFMDVIDGDYIRVVPFSVKEGVGDVIIYHDMRPEGMFYLVTLSAHDDVLEELAETMLFDRPFGPAEGVAFEPVTILDDGVTTLPLVQDGVVRADWDSVIKDPDEKWTDDLATYRGDAVSLRSCLTCSWYNLVPHHCPKIDAGITSVGERMRTTCAGWEPRFPEHCEHVDHCDGPCDACAFFLQPLEEGGAGACDRLDDQVTRARRPKDTACDHFTRTGRCGTCRHFCQPSPGQSVGACAHDQHDEPMPAQSKDVACEFHQLGGK